MSQAAPAVVGREGLSFREAHLRHIFLIKKQCFRYSLPVNQLCWFRADQKKVPEKMLPHSEG
jgi:hypothetical protein